MQYMDAKRAANEWGLSLRRVQDLCREGKVSGATRFGKSWMIPTSSARPADFRRAHVRQNVHDYVPLTRKSPFLDMTDLYHTAGKADDCVAQTRSNEITHDLFEAQIAYTRGDIEFVYRRARHFLEQHTGFYGAIAGGLLLSMTAVWKGDVAMWKKARSHICSAPHTNEFAADIIALSVAAMESFIRRSEGYPDWFCRGSFDHLPVDSHPAARVYYVRYLLVKAHELAIGRLELPDVTGLGLMKCLPHIIEPMITQMQTDRIVMAEIYLRLNCAIAYHQTGETRLAAEHLDRAIGLCLADGLLVPLVEHRRQFGAFLDERIARCDPAALLRVKTLHKQLREGWARVHNGALDRTFSAHLSAREAEVARLAAFGFTDAQIAARLFLSESSIKSILRSAKNKTGVTKRRELADFI